MATLAYQFLAGQFALGDLVFAPLTAQADTSASSVTFNTAGGFTYTLNGSFTFDGSGKLADGTITGFTYSQGTLFTALVVTGVSVTVAAYKTLAAANDQAGLQALFFGGKDTVTTDFMGPATIRTFGGDDTITDANGSTYYDGGDGFDTVIFAAGTNGAAPTFTRVGNELHVTSVGFFGTDTDRLVNVEAIQVGTKTYYNLAGDEATIARLYSAAFARAPDAPGLAWQENALHQGLSPLQLAQNFIGSAEFKSLYGVVDSLSNTQYATLLYRNILSRSPDDAGLAWQVKALDEGLSRSQLLLNFADAPENKAKVTGDWLLA